MKMCNFYSLIFTLNFWSQGQKKSLGAWSKVHLFVQIYNLDLALSNHHQFAEVTMCKILKKVASNRRSCKRQIDGSTSIKLAIVQVSNQHGCTSIDSAIAQSSNQRLYKRRIDVCLSVELTNGQASIRRLQLFNRPLQLSNRRLY